MFKQIFRFTCFIFCFPWWSQVVLILILLDKLTHHLLRFPYKLISIVDNENFWYLPFREEAPTQPNNCYSIHTERAIYVRNYFLVVLFGDLSVTPAFIITLRYRVTFLVWIYVRGLGVSSLFDYVGLRYLSPWIYF